MLWALLTWPVTRPKFCICVFMLDLDCFVMLIRVLTWDSIESTVTLLSVNALVFESRGILPSSTKSARSRAPWTTDAASPRLESSFSCISVASSNARADRTFPSTVSTHITPPAIYGSSSGVGPWCRGPRFSTTCRSRSLMFSNFNPQQHDRFARSRFSSTSSPSSIAAAAGCGFGLQCLAHSPPFTFAWRPIALDASEHLASLELWSFVSRQGHTSTVPLGTKQGSTMLLRPSRSASSTRPRATSMSTRPGVLGLSCASFMVTICLASWSAMPLFAISWNCSSSGLPITLVCMMPRPRSTRSVTVVPSGSKPGCCRPPPRVGVVQLGLFHVTSNGSSQNFLHVTRFSGCTGQSARAMLGLSAT